MNQRQQKPLRDFDLENQEKDDRLNYQHTLRNDPAAARSFHKGGVPWREEMGETLHVCTHCQAIAEQCPVCRKAAGN